MTADRDYEPADTELLQWLAWYWPDAPEPYLQSVKPFYRPLEVAIWQQWVRFGRSQEPRQGHSRDSRD